ncbi:SDR family NAD(P)-dependent oxidoreductase [Sandaracinobacteroides saxicola]|uniref:SDR family oxidoreductase n=1 Tax=Sandaracinobacteroides saxicola TaxID=2759707 RepID=A0A7G5IGY7_9SPHN|nr:SDR family NAD(P)-dependent oxidoreductase [Sandaracinobacteroides saxicola]QMW22629.1 SDR family oxidoreductase [Sandaracinobacteroides saxicola]
MTPRSIAGATALITGAASGMGRATAQLFAGEAAHVAVTDRDHEGAESVAQEIRAQGGSARAWPLDVSDPAAIRETVAQVAAWHNRLDILVNNAGIAGFAPVDSPDYDALFARMLATNLTAHQRLIRAALPHLRRSPAPRIINIASTEALGATSQDSAYAAAKAGVTGLTRALAVELGRDGITVNCLCPGPIDTGMTATIPDADKSLYAKRRTALGRYGQPHEVAHLTLALAQPGASYITGTTIPVDGGLMARNA